MNVTFQTMSEAQKFNFIPTDSEKTEEVTTLPSIYIYETINVELHLLAQRQTISSQIIIVNILPENQMRIESKIISNLQPKTKLKKIHYTIYITNNSKNNK